MDTPFLANLIQGFRQVALMDALMARKACLFGEPQWIVAARRTFTGHVAELSNLAMRIPAILEQADKLVHAKRATPDVCEIATALTFCVELERELMDWRLQWYRDPAVEVHPTDISHKSASCAQPYRTAGIEKYPAFLERFPDVARAFSTVIEYPSFTAAAWHDYYWACLITLREAILDVSRLNPQPLLRSSNQDEVLTAAVYECADSLCQAVPFTRENYANCFSGILVISGPLQLASKWYERQGDVAKLAWCRAMEDDLNSGPLNVPYVQRNALLSRRFALLGG
ncbi:hypothetical protein LTR85_005243 [Meristemomyces frigidus]|nr:hypothetical protein LTR85_005243 [Meristemomyces frigidus]